VVGSQLLDLVEVAAHELGACTVTVGRGLLLGERDTGASGADDGRDGECGGEVTRLHWGDLQMGGSMPASVAVRCEGSVKSLPDRSSGRHYGHPDG
jgi:hypothetical protein